MKKSVRKRCSRCGGDGPFNKNKSASDGLQKYCRACQKEVMAALYRRDKAKILERCRQYREAHPEKYKEYDRKTKASNPARYMWLKARERARRRGVAFEIEIEDIFIPLWCPLLGVPLLTSRGKVSPNSPTLDRKIPTLGYVKGNVWVISHRANAVKNDASVEEIELVAKNLRAEMVRCKGEK